MVERELAARIVEMVDEAAYRHAVQRVVRVHVELGGRHVLDLDDLQHNFQQAAHATVAEGAELCLRVLPVHRHCSGCGSNFESARDLRPTGANTGEAGAPETPCPKCGHPDTEALDGEEARLVGMEIETEIKASA